MKCPKCQHENPEDARFCNGCGHALDEKLSNILPPLQELLSLSADDEAFS